MLRKLCGMCELTNVCIWESVLGRVHEWLCVRIRSVLVTKTNSQDSRPDAQTSPGSVPTQLKV